METDEYTETTAGGASPAGPLRRDPEDKVVAGVCSGLGRHFGIDPVIFRIGFVALTLAGAAGLVVYGLAWLFIPESGGEASKAAGLSRHRIPERLMFSLEVLAVLRAVDVGPALDVVLDYCAAVRGVLNDDQGGPLHPPGLRMAEALGEVRQSLQRNLDAKKGGVPSRS